MQPGFREIVDSCPSAMLIAQNGQLVYANLAATALLRAGNGLDLIGRSAGDLNRSGRCRISTLDGNQLEVEVSAEAVSFNGGPATTIVLRDITEQLVAAQLLEQANRIAGLGRLAATVAHEFNNVLMAIQPHAEIMRRKGGDAVAVAKSCDAIEQGIKRGKAITEDILRFARPVEPAMSRVLLNDWLAGFVNDVRAQNMTGIDLVLEIGPHDEYVMADLRQIEQILWNLVLNARDSMPGGGRLTITSGICSQCETRCDVLPTDDLAPFTCVRVTDTGHGIPDELMSKIFEPLFTTKKNGTGLGLAVAHQIATRHRGHLFAKSRVGEGTSFYLLLRTG